MFFTYFFFSFLFNKFRKVVTVIFLYFTSLNPEMCMWWRWLVRCSRILFFFVIPIHFISKLLRKIVCEGSYRTQKMWFLTFGQREIYNSKISYASAWKFVVWSIFYVYINFRYGILITELPFLVHNKLCTFLFHP